MDKVDKYITIRDGDVVMRLDAQEAPVLREYAMALAKQALSTLAARYEFTPRGPILVEIFPKHDDFAVRTLGLPGMTGALGVCFGRVVTMDSPRARPPGSASRSSPAVTKARRAKKSSGNSRMAASISSPARMPCFRKASSSATSASPSSMSSIVLVCISVSRWATRARRPIFS